MASNPYRHLRPGDRLQGLPSEPWNRMLRGLKGGAPPPGVGLPSEGPVEIQVKNTTGKPLDRFSVLRIDTPTFPYDKDPTTFLSRDAMDGESPSASTQTIVITQTALDIDAIGPARLLGLSRVRVDVIDTEHVYAAPTTEPGYLTSNTAGPARILWTEHEGEETGQQWAVVLLPGAAGASSGASWDYGVMYEVFEVVGGGESDVSFSAPGNYLVTGHFVLFDPTKPREPELKVSGLVGATIYGPANTLSQELQFWEEEAILADRVTVTGAIDITWWVVASVAGAGLRFSTLGTGTGSPTTMRGTVVAHRFRAGTGSDEAFHEGDTLFGGTF